MVNKVVVFNEVKKSYGSQQILSGIELELNQGEFLGLIGINGAGKTTLIKCMLDFTSLDSGSITIFKQKQSMATAREKLAYLPERFMPPYYLSGQDFLEYSSKLYQQEYNPERVKQILTTLDLDIKVLSKPVRQFSKGMSQKLGLAACLLSNKDLVIMDEPMSGLDHKARTYLKKYLLELKQENLTLFFNTHMLFDAEAVCDKVAILHNGIIQFLGSPAECCDKFNTHDFRQAYLRCVETDRC